MTAKQIKKEQNKQNETNNHSNKCDNNYNAEKDEFKSKNKKQIHYHILKKKMLQIIKKKNQKRNNKKRNSDTQKPTTNTVSNQLIQRNFCDKIKYRLHTSKTELKKKQTVCHLFF